MLFENVNKSIFSFRTIISIFILLSILGSSLTVYDYWKVNHNANTDGLIDNASNQSYGTLQASESSINNAAAAECQVPTQELQHTTTKRISDDRTDLISPTTIELQTVVSHVQPPGKMFIAFIIIIVKQHCLIFLNYVLSICEDFLNLSNNIYQ